MELRKNWLISLRTLSIKSVFNRTRKRGRENHLGRLRRMAGNEQGSQAIEFVGVLPLFLLMILIVTQFVYAGVTVVVAKQVAMEGARAAMVELTSGANYEAAVRNAAGKYKVNSLSKHEYISGSDTYVTVKVTLESPIVTGGLFRSSGISLPVSSEVTVRKEELE